MTAEGSKTSSGDLIFTRHFDDAVEGNYQYKIRVGEGHWVVDESKETGRPVLKIRNVNTNMLQPRMSMATATM